MKMKRITPDRHTFVAVLKACSQLGDVKTAYDILQEMKIHNFPMTEHVYNELIRVYAGAAAVQHVKEEHVDMYIKDAMELFKTMVNEGQVDVNIHILNSLTLLYCNSLRAEQLEAEILPLYEKYRIKHDIYTYQNLSRLFVNLRELDTAMSLYQKMKNKDGLKPN